MYLIDKDKFLEKIKILFDDRIEECLWKDDFQKSAMLKKLYKDIEKIKE